MKCDSLLPLHNNNNNGASFGVKAWCGMVRQKSTEEEGQFRNQIFKTAEEPTENQCDRKALRPYSASLCCLRNRARKRWVMIDNSPDAEVIKKKGEKAVRCRGRGGTVQLEQQNLLLFLPNSIIKILPLEVCKTSWWTQLTGTTSSSSSSSCAASPPPLSALAALELSDDDSPRILGLMKRAEKPTTAAKNNKKEKGRDHFVSAVGSNPVQSAGGDLQTKGAGISA